MLKHYKVNIMTKEINVEWNTLRDRVKKMISHLGDLEIKELTKDVRERVPLEEVDLREPPCSPYRCPVTGEGDLRR
jgi:hypothetical protein